ncbi:MAG: Ldh family oxidoreductase, partial [Bacteroidales bacterium]|nr:Ldh family oxidoreductase [Bacteroidales bacterium]
MSFEKIRIPYTEMENTLQKKLLKYGFTADRAKRCASIFTNNSLDGIYTHGVNRFSMFIRYIKSNYIDVNAQAKLINTLGTIEQWDGNLGPGPLNATFCTERAMKLADTGGMGCVTLSNTNHWMRGGSYGWQAAKSGYVFIGWTNTEANLPAWG